MPNSLKRLRSSRSSISSLSLPPAVDDATTESSPSRSISSPLLHVLKHRRKHVVVVHQKKNQPDRGDLSEPRPFTLTRWMEMKLEFGLKLYRNILASFFTWILLAGYVVFPGTFASIRRSQALNEFGTAGMVVVNVVQNVGLLVLAGILCSCGAVGITWLWWENQDNYIWLVERIFL